MPKQSEASNSESEDNEETPENSGSESESESESEEFQQQPQIPSTTNGVGVTDYEKQRLSRIAENRARMEALGLPNIASSFLGSAQIVSNKKKGKKKVDDDDYRPDKVEEELGCGSEERTTAGSRRKKVGSLIYVCMFVIYYKVIIFHRFQFATSVISQKCHTCCC